MRLTTKCEYALLAILTLAKSYRRNKDRYLTVKEIAARNNIPKEFLEKIVSSLSKSGFLKSQTGVRGGVKLAKGPSKITIAQVIRVIDGPMAPVSCVSKLKYESSPIEKSRNLTYLFQRIRDIQNKILTKTTFNDLI